MDGLLVQLKKLYTVLKGQQSDDQQVDKGWFFTPRLSSRSDRNFLGTKETSLLLMAMFLLAVFYHGQQVRPGQLQLFHTQWFPQPKANHSFFI